jgi:hypothetical protein
MQPETTYASPQQASWPTERPQPNQAPGGLWVTLSGKDSVFKWKRSKNAQEENDPQFVFMFSQLRLEYDAEGNPRANIGPHWELQLLGSHQTLGEVQIKISASSIVYRVIERFQEIRSGQIVSLTLTPAGNTCFVDVHIWDGKAWQTVRLDKLPLRFKSDSPEDSYRKAIVWLGKHPAFEGWSGEPLPYEPIPDMGQAPGQYPATPPPPQQPVQPSANSVSAAQQIDAQSLGFEIKPDAKVFDFTPPRHPMPAWWREVPTDSLLSGVQSKLKARELVPIDDMTPNAAPYLEVVTKALGVPSAFRATRAGWLYLFDFLANASVEQVGQLKEESARPKADPASPEFDPFDE